jgi:hypothetical protein
MSMTTINASSGPPPADTPTCTPCETLMVNTGAVWRCLCCDAVQPRGEFAEFVRLIARGTGMSPSDTPAAIAARVARNHHDLTALRPAIAAFRACYEGLPSHVAVRPVCATASCDNLPKRGNLCNRCYEQRPVGLRYEQQGEG